MRNKNLDTKKEEPRNEDAKDQRKRGKRNTKKNKKNSKRKDTKGHYIFGDPLKFGIGLFYF